MRYQTVTARRPGLERSVGDSGGHVDTTERPPILVPAVETEVEGEASKEPRRSHHVPDPCIPVAERVTRRIAARFLSPHEAGRGSRRSRARAPRRSAAGATGACTSARRPRCRRRAPPESDPNPREGAPPRRPMEMAPNGRRLRRRGRPLRACGARGRPERRARRRRRIHRRKSRRPPIAGCRRSSAAR